MGSISEVKDAVAGLLREVPGVTRVETKVLGQVPWAQKAAPKQSFWVVQAVRREERDAGIGCQGLRTTTVRIDGWMPFSYSNPDTTPAWEALVDGVCDALRANRSLGLTVNDAGLPQVVVNDYEGFASSASDSREVLCHHVAIDVAVQEYLVYETG